MPRNTILIVRGEDLFSPTLCSVIVIGPWVLPVGIDESESAMIRRIWSVCLGRMISHGEFKDCSILSVVQDSIVGTVKSPRGTMSTFDSLPSTRTAFCTASEAV